MSSISPFHPDNLERTLFTVFHSLPSFFKIDTITTLAKQILEEMAKSQSPRFISFLESREVLVLDRSRIVIIWEHPLGEGAFKIVRKGTLVSEENPNHDLAVAIPKPSKPDTAAHRAYLNELVRSEEIRKKPIQGVAEVFEIARNIQMLDGTTTDIILQRFYNQGDLRHYASLLGGFSSLPPEEKRTIQYQLIRALVNLAERGYVHCDIKIENILINKVEKQIEVAFTDLAYMRNMRSEEPTVPCQGSVFSICPEFVELMLRWDTLTAEAQTTEKNRVTSSKADVWSMSLVLLVLEGNASLLNKIIPPKSTPQQAFKLLKSYYEAGSLPNFPEPKDKESMLHFIWRSLRPRQEDRFSATRELEERFLSIQAQEQLRCQEATQ